MNPKFLGDSYDLVKRFFVGELYDLGYEVVADPMFTGDWGGRERTYFKLLQAKRNAGPVRQSAQTALLLDPDTGVTEKAGRRHVSLDRIADESLNHEIVCSFDQSFSRREPVADAMRRKLDVLATLGLFGLYYDSHARFLFASRGARRIASLRKHLESVGIPSVRLIS